MTTDYGEHDPRNVPDPRKRESTRDLLRKHGHGSPDHPKRTDAPKDTPDDDQPREKSTATMRRHTGGRLPAPREVNRPRDDER